MRTHQIFFQLQKTPREDKQLKRNHEFIKHLRDDYLSFSEFSELQYGKHYAFRIDPKMFVWGEQILRELSLQKDFTFMERKDCDCLCHKGSGILDCSCSWGASCYPSKELGRSLSE